MILQADIHSKDIGAKQLLKDAHLKIEKHEKIGIIGNNGTGKSTLIGILTNQDDEYDGEVRLQKGVTAVWARQEHSDHSDTKVIDYILAELPEYSRLHKIIEGYAGLEDPKDADMQRYSDAIERFSDLGYFEVENSLESLFDKYQINRELLHRPLGTLSGGQKRMIELIKLQQSNAGLLIFDEPTNHMDYVAKAEFISWFKSVHAAVLVVSHDRDVLGVVDRVIDLRDGTLHPYKGNYDDYLKTHSVKISGAVNEYEVQQRRIVRLRDDIIRYQRLKEKARNPGTIQRFKRLEERSREELSDLEKAAKPTFWIDKEAAKDLNSSMQEAYGKHKSDTIKINTKTNQAVTTQPLLKVQELSLGYDAPLFKGLQFELAAGERLRIVGRNGAGKTTLFSAIINSYLKQPISSEIYNGLIDLHKEVRLGVYEQEVPANLLKMTLGEAVEKVMADQGLPVSEQVVKAELNKYLFDAHADYGQPVKHLSGGQKARLQLIRMLINKPNVLLLDEPTNHLDLPSIEELEQAVNEFEGAVLYISHDSYFAKNLGGKQIQI